MINMSMLIDKTCFKIAALALTTALFSLHAAIAQKISGKPPVDESALSMRANEEASKKLAQPPNNLFTMQRFDPTSLPQIGPYGTRAPLTGFHIEEHPLSTSKSGSPGFMSADNMNNIATQIMHKGLHTRRGNFSVNDQKWNINNSWGIVIARGSTPPPSKRRNPGQLQPLP